MAEQTVYTEFCGLLKEKLSNDQPELVKICLETTIDVLSTSNNLLALEEELKKLINKQGADC